MDTALYLDRIGMTGPIEPTAACLGRLQQAHLVTVPYENLDILAGRPILLTEDALFEKIVARRRGGYCFELNELFGRLLRALGYGVTDSFGRFLRGETGIPMRRHHVLLVKPQDDDARWLADVGVGTGSPTRPMRLVEGEVLRDGADTYGLRRDDFLGWVLTERRGDVWRDVYSFTEEPQLPVDFVAASFYCEKSPDSIFNKAPMVSLRTETGRRTRDGDEFRLFEGGRVSVVAAPGEAERRALMREWFGIDTECLLK